METEDERRLHFHSALQASLRAFDSWLARHERAEVPPEAGSRRVEW